MISQLLHTPEFTAPLPSWILGASLTLSAILGTTCALVPTHFDTAPAEIVVAAAR